MNLRRLISASALVALAPLAGCSHEIKSPDVSAASGVGAVDPDLVCVEQLTTLVTLHGDGFTPMATKTLDPPTQLVLPAVVLTRTQGLGAESSGGESYPIPDDPANTAGSRVRWTSEQQMAFQAYPELKLVPGLYDIVVTNPDGTHSATFSGGLAAVPAPTLATVVPDLSCDAQADQAFVVAGTGILSVGTALPTVHAGGKDFEVTKVEDCADVPGVHAAGQVQICKKASFTVPKGTFEPGNYDLTLTNPSPANCVSSEKVTLAIVAPPSIASIQPLAVCDAQGDQTVSITGTGFLELGSAGDGGTGTLPTVAIGTKTFTPSAAGGCTPLAGTFTEGAVQQCTSLTVTVPKGTFTSGTYPVTVTNPPPADCHSTETINLQVVDPPVVTGTQPATLCQGGGIISIDGQNFSSASKVTLQAAGQTSIASTGTTVNSAGTQITATFGGGATPGTVYDVVVDGGAGCVDQPPHKQITIVTGPIAFFADPEIVYNGINTRVTVYATALQQPLPANAVVMVPSGQAAPITQLTWNTVPNHPNRVQVVVPKGQAPGSYDIIVNDATGCSTLLSAAITVVDQSALTVTVKSIVPPFGFDQTETAITVLRDKAAAAPGDKPFVATPRLFLNPTNPQATDIAIQVESVSFVDAATLTAVVPKNEPVHAYDLVLVNPDGSVGYLADAFSVVAVAPPTIGTVTPSSIVSATGQAVTITGQSFSGSTVTLSCVDANGNSLAAPNVASGAESCAGGSCTKAATIDGSGLPVGAICVLRVTNADGTYADYSAIGVTGPSLNLPGTHAGTAMNVGRRALAAASADATEAARFVYAIGGDGGQAAANAPFSSVEFASVDLYGKMGAWTSAKSSLNTARSFAASGKMGRYVYVAGGSDGATALASAERAMVLSPREVPIMDIDDLVPAAAGLDAGYWFYRVSATFDAADTDNPGGESLPSDEFIVKVPSFPGKKIQIVLAWTAPADSLGAPLPNVTGYNVYRTATVNGSSGGEVLLATVSSTTLKYTDDGAATPGTQSPLPLGSTGNWAKLADMGSARKGAAGAIAFDPVTPGKFYFYALLGLSPSNAALTTYDYLPVTILPNGHQTVGAWTAGASGVTQGRWQLGAFVADSSVASVIPAGTTYVYLGGGIDAANAAANAVDAGKVAAGGDLGAFSATPKDFSSNSAGYGVCAANDQLFAFGGAGAAPSAGAKSASIVSPAPALANNSWNSEGINLVDSRYLMGSSVQSAFIFLVGGQTATSPASQSTELVIW